MDANAIVSLIADMGVPIALAFILLFWMRQSHNRVVARIEELENRDYTVLMKTISESTVATKENYRSLRRLTGAAQDMLTALKARPCLTDDSFYPHQSVHAKHNLPRVQSPTGDTTKEETKEVEA